MHSRELHAITLEWGIRRTKNAGLQARRRERIALPLGAAFVPLGLHAALEGAPFVA